MLEKYRFDPAARPVVHRRGEDAHGQIVDAEKTTAEQNTIDILKASSNMNRNTE